MTAVKLAIIQIEIDRDIKVNIAKAHDYIAQAAKCGAQIVLLPELFATHYFCQEEKEEFFLLAHTVENHPFIHLFQTLAKQRLYFHFYP